MTASPAKLIFLPGASGNTQFWRPVAERLAHPARQVHIGWPGFGDTPPEPDVTGMKDLVTRVLAEIDRPTALVELSMPVLLLWGDADPISPVRVGQRLAQLLPCAELHVFPGADHSLGFTHAEEAARLIDGHLSSR